MSWSAQPSLERLEVLRQQHHQGCYACASSEFRLEFNLTMDGSVVASRTFGRHCCSYSSHVHGGLLSLCVDEAMTCGLMAHGVVAVTARLNLRYLRPVMPDVPTVISARLSSANPPLFEMEVSIMQDTRVMVKANAKFMRRMPGSDTALLDSNGLTHATVPKGEAFTLASCSNS